MEQLTDFQRKVIVLFKEENPTWGLTKCSEVLPNFFSKISKRQMDRVVSNLKRHGSPVAASRMMGSGRRRSIDSPTKEAIVNLALTPPDRTRRHLSQREIASELNISKGTVFQVLNESSLQCYKRVQCQGLSEANRIARKQKSMLLINRFEDQWRGVWFSDEASFSLHPSLNKQNERIYRSVTCKTNIPPEDLVVESDRQQQSIMCYGAMSWYGKTELRFIEGYAEGQEHLPAYRRKKKTVNHETYTQEMLPQMFNDISHVMDGDSWCWQQDGARAHTARCTIQWLEGNCPEFISPDLWPAKSPDLNLMDYCIWSLLLTEVQRNRTDILNIEDLKACLVASWNAIPMDTVKRATSSWVGRLKKCFDVDGGHFEYLG